MPTRESPAPSRRIVRDLHTQAFHQVGAAQRLEIDRLPCLATRAPAPAITNAAIVEMLNVEQPSPPVRTYR